MQTELTIEPTIKVKLPADKVIVDKATYDKIKHRADFSRWWSIKDLEERYGHQKQWFVANVFAPYEKKLRDRVVMYPHGGRSSYWVKPIEFAAFMDEHFSEISRKQWR